ncbi:MAG: Asp23/Gls24 family envelope stress response protein [Clostridia bacterium]|nr:Asp23/Gls24 family envelope stress response protein [Clostridia bacterium]MDR3645486.1 Asp23/Gls24 family envelope stress response protein [Clostridia bacterium]
MISLVNPNGSIIITQEYFTNLIGYAVSSCYGVADMAASGTAQGLASIFGREKLSRGVKVKSDGSELVIELHIIVTYGVNISAIVKSIMSKVSYTVEEATGLTVSSVNVFVDGMKTE